jgi:hypothetical protein
MNTLANVLPFLANKFTGLRGGRLAFFIVALGASNGFLFGHKKAPLKQTEGQFVFWRRAILLAVCLSVKNRGQNKSINARINQRETPA